MTILVGSSFPEPATQNRLVRIHAAVAQKRPIPSRVFALRRIAFDNENFLFVLRRLGNDFPKRVGDKRISPKLQPGIASPEFAPASRGALEAHAIHHRDIHAIGNRMPALNGPPGIELPRAELAFSAGCHPMLVG